MNKTQQQLDIIEAAKTGSNIVIKAFAGCGKTTTLGYVSEVLAKPSLYIAFNKSIAEEASRKFAGHVECKTINSLAWRAIVKTSKSAYGKKLQGFFDFSAIDEPLSLAKPEDMIQYKLEVTGLVTRFCQSSARDFREFMQTQSVVYPEAIDGALKLWTEASDPAKATGMTHDVYLKLYQLSNPVLPYSVIYLDEAQDSNPVTLDIILRQTHAQIIIVGDPYQSIYGWRGAINALDQLPSSFQHHYLSESFRFVPEIAKAATAITSIAGNTMPIIGKGAENPSSTTSAVLVRTNSTLLDILLKAVAKDDRVYVLADLSDLWKKIYHISALRFDNEIRFPDKELSQYRTYKELLKAAESMAELRKLINATLTLSTGGLTANINAIKAIIVDNEADATYTVSTVHKSKGLEWDNVIIAEDIIPFVSEGGLEEAILADQLLNVIYVAITRAKQKLSIPEDVMRLINNPRYFRELLEEALEEG